MAKSETDVPEGLVDAMANLEPGPESGPRPAEHGDGTFGQEGVLRLVHSADVWCPHSFLTRGAADHADGEPNCNREPSTMESWKTIAEEWHRLYYAWTRSLLAGEASTADRQIARRQARIARRRLKAAGIADTHAPPSDWPATFGRREPAKKVKPYRGMARDLAALQRVLQVFDHPERFPAIAAEIAKRLPVATQREKGHLA